jgi:hypothetical protein
MFRPLAGKLALAAGVAITFPLVALPASAASSPAPLGISDSALQATSTVVGGAKPQPSANTVTHFFSTAFNPLDSTTFGFNMVGQDPALQQSTTVTVDITPLNVNTGGLAFNGSDVLSSTLSSPVFTNNDYTTTPFVSDPTVTKGFRANAESLSPDNTSNQLEDAIMRSQFNEQGTGYHLILNPVVHPAITIDVPSELGTLIQTPRGVVAGDVQVKWWSTRIQNLNNSLSYADPTHLQLYLTDNVMLFSGTNPLNCCIIGFHGASEVVGHGTGSTHGNGNQKIQTFAWASYVTPGFFNPQRAWTLQDIDALSHEVSEWADDPFINSFVQPWTSPAIAPTCSNILETGDPVVGVGFAKEANVFRQGPTPNGTQVADGFYHPEDEALLPWFMRLNPSPAQLAQSGTNGRYVFMGDLNPFPVFHAAPPACPA